MTPYVRNNLRAMACLVKGHKWVERKPHHMWAINIFDCSRCGATKNAGFDGRAL